MTESTMIPCDQVIAKLWEYLDGELTEERAARVQTHLDVCARCFPQYEFQRAYKVFIRRSSATQEMPPAARRRVFEAILEEESGRSLTDGMRPSLLGRLRAAIRSFIRRPPG
jgi:mycothiol system anti-sigma-R factor